MGEIYNQRKLELIRKGVCTGCKIRPCQMSPEMVNICMFETFEYRLRSGRYNLGGNGNSVQKASDDVK